MTTPGGGAAVHIRRIPTFASMPEAMLAEMLSFGRALQFQPGDKLVGQGEASTFAIILLAGDVSVLNESRHGHAPVAQVSAPALLGEIGALADLPRTATLLALTPGHALCVERDVLLRVFGCAPDTLVSVIAQLGQQIRNTNDALGLYAGGLAALEQAHSQQTILDDLKSPTAELANFAAAFSQLARRIALERRHRSEMASAALIQQALLPNAIDAALLRGRCDVAGGMKPARDVGGDFYDHFMLDENRLAFAVGDVCGKGVPASLFMCVTVTTLRLAAKQFVTLPAMIEGVNAMLCEQNAASMFSTLFFGVLDLSNGRLEYVSCGHCPPLLFGPGRFTTVLAGGGVPLGLFPGRKWPAHAAVLRENEGVFVLTDGVTEAIAPDGEEYGEERVAALLRAGAGASPAGLVEGCIADVERFAAGAEQFDDITCVAVQLR